MASARIWRSSPARASSRAGRRRVVSPLRERRIFSLLQGKRGLWDSGLLRGEGPALANSNAGAAARFRTLRGRPPLPGDRRALARPTVGRALGLAVEPAAQAIGASGEALSTSCVAAEAGSPAGAHGSCYRRGHPLRKLQEWIYADCFAFRRRQCLRSMPGSRRPDRDGRGRRRSGAFLRGRSAPTGGRSQPRT